MHVLYGSKSKDEVESGRMECGGKDLVVVHTRTLCTALDNQACLVALHTAIWVQLDLEHPATAKWLNTRRAVNHLPGAVGSEVNNLLLRSNSPVWGVRRGHSLGVGVWCSCSSKLDIDISSIISWLLLLLAIIGFGNPPCAWRA